MTDPSIDWTAQRTDAPFTGAEKATLIGFLDYHRATLEWKCSGLTPAQLAERAVPASSMSLLGLVRHLADCERGWFGRIAGLGKRPDVFSTPERPDDDFDGAVAAPAVVDEAFASWHSAIEEARNVTASADLDATFQHQTEGAISTRWALIHMIEEYARHNGHADLLRQTIDGSVGE